MNSSNSMGDNHLGEDGNAIGSVSRSGRVRKKNSLLADYDSPDVIEKRGRKSNSATRGGSNATPRSHGKSPSIRGRKPHGYFQNIGTPRGNNHTGLDTLRSLAITHEPYDGEVPDIAAEEIIDDGVLDEEDRTRGLSNNIHLGLVGNYVRIKSQKQSTYMLEKSFSKQRKITGIGHSSSAKMKATRKDKGSPRVTAYMLWAKEQRAIFARKYPNLDFSTVSKKLSDLWATVPQNQKRMWKTKAAKIMKTKANGAENMKNSARPSLAVARKPIVQMMPQRKGMKNTTPVKVSSPKRPPGRPNKKGLNILSPSRKPVPGSSTHNHYPPSVSSQLKRVVPVVSKISDSRNSLLAGHVLNQLPAVDDIISEPYKLKVTSTDSLDVAAHLSLLGEQMKTLGAKLQCQNLPDQSMNESLSSLLDSLLCSVGPLLCLTQLVPEMNCIPESQLENILNNIGYVMPGL